MTAADVVAVAALERRIFTDPWSANAFRRELAGNEAIWLRVAEDPADGGLLGYLVAWFVLDEVHLANLAVIPECRRRGLGQALLDDLLDESRNRQATQVILEVRESNRPAQRLYERNGFRTVMIRPGYYRDNREDARVMIMTLGPDRPGDA
jgi:ribosomal-protein-alanine N-acetyltransferase